MDSNAIISGSNIVRLGGRSIFNVVGGKLGFRFISSAYIYNKSYSAQRDCSPFGVEDCAMRWF